MKLSIIIPVLNSHEIFRRQTLYWEKMGIPDEVEIIIVDDGSDPPLKYEGNLPLRILYTNDKRPWTQILAKNMGAREAKGKILFSLDLDFIFTKEAVIESMNLNCGKLHFKRELAVIDENGNLTQDYDTLIKWGVTEQRLKDRGVKIPPHTNVWAMPKDVFWELGGFDESRINRGYPQREECDMKRKWQRYVMQGKGKSSEVTPTIYMFPNGQYCGDKDFNPFGLFHTLSRKT